MPSTYLEEAIARVRSDSHWTDVERLIAEGYVFAVNHSAGKDSQAMQIILRHLIPAEQRLVIHAELPEVDWAGNLEHIAATVDDVPFLTTRAGKTFFEMVEHRGMFPSPQQRQCTSDLKRGPIERELRRFLKENPRYQGRIVSCTGIRAEESASRAKQIPFRFSERNSKAGRQWFEWMPVHEMLTLEVFGLIAEVGERPHWAYQAGMTRLSCSFCIMSSKPDLRTAARLRPDLYARYVATERRLDQTMMMPVAGQRRFLDEITGIPVPEARERAGRTVA